MKVLVVGSGGREHALVWKLSRSPLAPEIVCAPGNPGTARHARNVPVEAGDIEGLVALAKKEQPDLVVVGPEDPLVAGLADRLRDLKLRVFGPGAIGAKLEGSKVHAKELLDRHRIPTAQWRRFDRSGIAKSYLEGCKEWPQVVKADGLAAGKGVFVCADAKTACSAIDEVMEKRTLGAAGDRVVVEECLVGEEASLLSITDGETILILEPVMDHKQLLDGDLGPNTGGMGVVSPVTSIAKRVLRQVEQRVLVPTVHALRRDEIPFRGTLFTGLMLTDAGPRVLEYNVRFGDPETQAIVRRLKGDLLPILVACADGKLGEIEPPEWDERTVVGVVMAAEGYPQAAKKGAAIDGIEEAERDQDVVVFHAGTKRNLKGDLVVSGGRVLCVTACGADVHEARRRAYAAVAKIRFDGRQFRGDIGVREESRAALRPAPLLATEEPVVIQESDGGPALRRRKPVDPA
jgi:phosphoribosylamine--glycine ligase